jgi:DNA-binding transcriptional LysR family regulator
VANFQLVSLPHESRTRRTIDGAASSVGVTLHHIATVTQFTTMMSFVRAGVGIAIAPSGAIAGLLGKDLSVLKLIKPGRGFDMAAGQGADPGGQRICDRFRRDVAPQ